MAFLKQALCHSFAKVALVASPFTVFDVVNPVCREQVVSKNVRFEESCVARFHEIHQIANKFLFRVGFDDNSRQQVGSGGDFKSIKNGSIMLNIFWTDKGPFQNCYAVVTFSQIMGTLWYSCTVRQLFGKN